MQSVRTKLRVAHRVCHHAQGVIDMRHRMIGWMVMLLCVLVLAACGSSTRLAGRPRATPSPTPLPTAGTFSATISGPGASEA